MNVGPCAICGQDDPFNYLHPAGHVTCPEDEMLLPLGRQGGQWEKDISAEPQA